MLIGGLLSGVMYSLVAIGFVLIYKTSGVRNFAQGSMVLFAALSVVSLRERGVPFWMCLLATLALMTVLGLLIERLGGVHFDGPRGRHLFCLFGCDRRDAARLAIGPVAHRPRFRGHPRLRNGGAYHRVPVLRTKLIAFAASSFIIGIAGVLWAFAYLSVSSKPCSPRRKV